MPFFMLGFRRFNFQSTETAMAQNQLQVEYLRLTLVNDYHRQLRLPSKKQIENTERMIRECQFMPPIMIDSNNHIVSGAHLLAAARRMDMDEIPVIKVNNLDEVQVQLLRIAHDNIATQSICNKEALAEEFHELMIRIPDIDLTVTGLEVAEIDLILEIKHINEPEESIPQLETGPSIVQPGDLYQLGEHRLYCGDSLLPRSFEALMEDEKAQVCFTDAPYNVKIDGHVGNSGKTKHREFLQASGELDSDGFTEFLYTVKKLIAAHAQDGAIIFSCMDWRHLLEILTAGTRAGLTLQNLCVWNKDNGGMGSLYRSKHELVFVFKNGTGKHINNIELGKHGRYRTNVWDYPGVNSFGGGRMNELALHPTVKPVAMVSDALKDCSKRGGIVLDPFGGSGTTLIAAEKTGRKARLIELDPLYCDVTIRRWQALTGKQALNITTGQTFNKNQPSGGENA
jgi:DNA modification methylase